jgi:hypothetical protein
MDDIGDSLKAGLTGGLVGGPAIKPKFADIVGMLFPEIGLMTGRGMIGIINDEEKRKRRTGMKRGGTIKKMAKGGSTASKRADGCATKGKTKGRFV